MPRSADPAAIRKILAADRPWSVYALADLAPEYSRYAEWHIAADGRPALLLVYRGFETPVLFAQGAVADLGALLPEISGEHQFYLSVRPEAADLLHAGGYRLHDVKKMWRMTANPARFVSPARPAERLGPADSEALSSLHLDGDAAGESPPFFNAGMLRHGVYYGVREGGAMVAAAGTHVLAEEESVAAIGNVYTRRDRRGRGLGAQVSGAVVTELLRLGIRTIVLNVAESNAAAMRVYARLGFERYCEYREGIYRAGEWGGRPRLSGWACGPRIVMKTMWGRLPACGGLSGRPNGISISYGGFSTVRGTSTSRQMAGLETRRRTGVLPHAIGRSEPK
ncbi:MAG TPA: GNAT family N-acetyltransferase [Bryobacteraceae bacterium]|jgi:ribosomal protein S18 acetylase RimI-like enzyme|nr:GNAT family N-acetyltransferase [Bryobacteraceae bacterium]